MPSTSSKNGEIGVAAGLLAVSLFLIVTDIRMPLGTAVLPGPGVMPLAIGLALGVTAVALLFAVMKSPRKTAIVQMGSRHILVAFLGLVWISLFFERLGFLLCLGVFLFFLTREFSRQGWIKPLVFAVLAVAWAYWFFVRILNVSLPRGIL